MNNGVTEKLEALIVEMMSLGLVPQTRMGQSLCEQERVPKLMADAFLERIQGRKFTLPEPFFQERGFFSCAFGV